MQLIRNVLNLNPILTVALLAWFVAQVLKTLINFILLGKFQLERMWGDGGMPSAHSATVCSMVIATARSEGFGSAIFASLTAILGKIGISGVESNLGTAIRTCVVLVMAWVMVFATGKQHAVREIPGRELGFICLSGLATGASWLCYYKALQDGLASVVVPIDKLSILVTVAFSYVVFRERLSKRSAVGLLLIVAGTLVMLIP